MFQTFSESSTKVVDTSDENSSNWLMFIKPACVSAEQNLVAFQHGSNVYFVTRMDINPGQELRYWFAKDYARLLGQFIFSLFFCEAMLFLFDMFWTFSLDS